MFDGWCPSWWRLTNQHALTLSWGFRSCQSKHFASWSSNFFFNCFPLLSSSAQSPPTSCAVFEACELSGQMTESCLTLSFEERKNYRSHSHDLPRRSKKFSNFYHLSFKLRLRVLVKTIPELRMLSSEWNLASLRILYGEISLQKYFRKYLAWVQRCFPQTLDGCLRQ